MKTGSGAPIASTILDWQDAQERAAAALQRSEQAEASGDLKAALRHALDARDAVARSNWEKSTQAEARDFQTQVDQRLRELDSAGAGRAPSGSPPRNIKIR